MEKGKKPANWRLWLAGTLALLVLIVALQNSQEIDVDVLMVNVTAPLIVVILASALVGAVVGYIVPLVRRHRREEKDPR